MVFCVCVYASLNISPYHKLCHRSYMVFCVCEILCAVIVTLLLMLFVHITGTNLGGCNSTILSVNLNASTSYANIGDYVLFHCMNGYLLEGAGALICDANNTWSGLFPACVTRRGMSVVSSTLNHILIWTIVSVVKVYHMTNSLSHIIMASYPIFYVTWLSTTITHINISCSWKMCYWTSQLSKYDVQTL